MKRLLVDLAELCAALDEPRGGPVRAFFDRVSGEIEHLPRDLEVEGVYDDVFAAPERWVEVQPVPQAERKRLRARFLDEVTDPQVRLRLGDALAGERPFSAFARVLRETPGLLDAWVAFRNRALETAALAWLAALGIEPGAAPGGAPRLH